MTVAELSEVFKDLERLDEAWDVKLDSLSKQHENISDIIIQNPFATRLFHYFVFRHLHETGIDFCVLCTYFLFALKGDIYENARMFSSEIEYSDENIEIIMQSVFGFDE